VRPILYLFCSRVDTKYFLVLRLEPNDVDATQTKLFLLLQTEQYLAALSWMGDDTSQHAFERAYSLYRLQREVDTSELLNQIRAAGKEDRGVLHLTAQMVRSQVVVRTHPCTFTHSLSLELSPRIIPNSIRYLQSAIGQRRTSTHPILFVFEQVNSRDDHQQSEEYSDILTNLQACQKHFDFINTGFRHALDALPSSVAVRLESAPPPQPTSSIAAVLASTSSSSAGGVDAPAIEKKKKVRMKRVPPGVVPGVTPPPDPERWLKKSERTIVAQGNKRRKGGGGGGGGGATQGSTLEHNPTPNVPPTKSGGGQSKNKKKK
jgi:signal recognition particle subunit SRP72